MENNYQDNDDNFADLLKNSISGVNSLQAGQIIETEIVSISADCIFLHLGGKSEGQLDAAEMTDKDGKLTVKEGDTIKAYFVSSQNGQMQFTTKISGDKGGNAVLENAFESGIPVEGVVEKEIKGGYEVKIGDSRAFCPYSQIGLKRSNDPEKYIGQHLTFKILEYSENGRNILLSNRIIAEEENKAKIEILKKSLHENMKVNGTVTSIQDFGAFVDIHGVQALLPISEISRNRVEKIDKYLSIGQELELMLLKLDWENERISVSMKALLPDPWDEAKTKYRIDSKHTGTIVRTTNFGTFVSLEPGLDGLIHISELEGDSRVNPSRETLKVGKSIEVQINSIDVENKRISLKPAANSENNEDYKQYMENETDTDTYNPFGNLLKDRIKNKQ